MGDAGFFKGTSAGQDTRFSDKHKQMLKSMKFPPEFNQKVDMKKVNMKVIKDWMAERVIQLLGIEDEVVVEYAIGMLEEPSPDPKSMQINLQGFLDKNTQLFVLELWKLLISAQTSLGGIPQQFLDITKAEILKTKQAKEDALARIREQEEKERVIAAELKQKAQAIREASRPKALDIAKEPAVARTEPNSKPVPVQDNRKAHEERRSREFEREREREREQERERVRGRRDRSRSRDAGGYGGGRRHDTRREDRYRERSRDRDHRKYYRRDDDYYRGAGSRRRSHSRTREYSRERGRSQRDDYGGRSRDRSEDRDRDRYGRRGGDIGADSSKRRRVRSQSRSRSRSRSRTIRKGTRSRSRTPPSANTSSVATNGESKTAPTPVDPKILENQLREKLLRERVLQSVKSKRASTDAGSSQNQA
ncbi:hypothetical protein BG015_004607 [Linnemannia schmuckeri]|uniref:PWI domain-containing protein n=1 Tax=Linnemannia schmuckeri TaxID=64567 RepID=A0A9P5UZ37_9FUNG|nr:hypothetical protein BG015_004607 [Linnemannia schmuckeri]